MANTWIISPSWQQDVLETHHGVLAKSDDSSIDTTQSAWNRTVELIQESVTGGQIYTNGIMSTYALVYTTSQAYSGAVLAPNGDIHFIPYSAVVGQKVSAAGVVSTYSLPYTGSQRYKGGVLAPNGDIHFIPQLASVGQKISAAGVVSTYSLLATNGGGAYSVVVLAPNGDINF